MKKLFNYFVVLAYTFAVAVMILDVFYWRAG